MFNGFCWGRVRCLVAHLCWSSYIASRTRGAMSMFCWCPSHNLPFWEMGQPHMSIYKRPARNVSGGKVCDWAYPCIIMANCNAALSQLPIGRLVGYWWKAKLLQCGFSAAALAAPSAAIFPLVTWLVALVWAAHLQTTIYEGRRTTSCRLPINVVLISGMWLRIGLPSDFRYILCLNVSLHLDETCAARSEETAWRTSRVRGAYPTMSNEAQSACSAAATAWRQHDKPAASA